MTRKDYELIARVFRSYADADAATAAAQNDTTGHYKYTQSETDRARITRLECMAESMCNALRLDNPRFNRETFLKACGL